MARGAVAATADRELAAGLTRVRNQPRDVAGAAGAGDQRATRVDVPGEDHARLVVSAIHRSQDPALDLLRQGREHQAAPPRVNSTVTAGHGKTPAHIVGRTGLVIRVSAGRFKTASPSCRALHTAGPATAGPPRWGSVGRPPYRIRKSARRTGLTIALTVLGVDRRMREIAAWVQEATPQLVELVLARMRVEAPAYFASENPEFMEMARVSIAANLKAVAEGLASGRAQPVHLPLGAVEEALIAAQERMPWTLVDRTYRIGQAVLLEQLMEAVETWRLESAERLDLLRVTSHFLFQYVDHVTGGLAEIHQAE